MGRKNQTEHKQSRKEPYPKGAVAIVECDDECLCAAIKGNDGIWRDGDDQPLNVVRIVSKHLKP